MTDNIAQTPINFKQPWYTLDLEYAGLGVDVRVNDIYLEQDEYGEHSHDIYDIGTSILDGENEIKIITYPFYKKGRGASQEINFHPNAEVIATIYVSEKTDKTGPKVMLSQIIFRPSEIEDKKLSDSAVIKGVNAPNIDYQSKTINPTTFRKYENQIIVTRKTRPIKSPYPRWEWQDGQDIVDTQENYDNLLKKYKEIWDAYNARDKQKLRELYAPTAKEFAIAYYLGDVEAGHAFIETGEILDEEGPELYKFADKGSFLDIYANGKIARIVDGAQYHPVIFYDKKNRLVHTLKFGFYKNKQGEWIMIR